MNLEKFRERYGDSGVILKVQTRRNSESQDWYDAPWLDVEDVTQQNIEYGWRKYRIVRVRL